MKRRFAAGLRRYLLMRCSNLLFSGGAAFANGKIAGISRFCSENPKPALPKSFVTVRGRELFGSDQNRPTAKRLITMKYSALELTSASPRTLHRTAQPRAGEIRAISFNSEPESRLWKLSSTALSPVKRGLETGLFLIAGLVGIGAVVYGLGHLLAFIHSDSLTRTVTALLQ